MLYLQPVITAFFVAIPIGDYQVAGFPSGGASSSGERITYEDLGIPPNRYHDLVGQLAALNRVTRSSAWRILNFYDRVDIKDTLAAVLVGLSRKPPNGEIDYILAAYFFSELEKFAPEFVTAVKTAGMIIYGDKRFLAANEPLNYDHLFRHSVTFHYGHEYSDQLSPRFFELRNLIYKAMEGNTDAAKEIVTTLAQQYPDFSNLGNLNRAATVDDLLKELKFYVANCVLPIIKKAQKDKGFK